MSAVLSTAPAPELAPPAAPLDADERLHALDILRGLALFCMILVHFHQKMRLEMKGPEDLIGWGVYVLVEQKAWGTFAFLFGVGFAILLRRLEARHTPVVAIYLRRLAMLALFGVVAELGFGFQILFSYACWGIPLLLIRRWSSRALLVTAGLASTARPVVTLVPAFYGWLTGVHVAQNGTVPALRHAVALAEQQSSYGVLFAARWSLFVGTLAHGWRDLLPDTNLALFVIGLLALRHGVLDQPRRRVRLIAGWMGFGAVAWAVSWLVLRNLPTSGVPDLDWPLAEGLGILRDQWLCFTYIGGVLLLLAYRPVWTARLAPIGRAGRMALTNYMLQAAVLDVLASGYGLGLKLRPLVYAPAAVGFFAVVAALSTAWLRRYRFGPFEWVWRMVTYARIQPLRRGSRLSLQNP